MGRPAVLKIDILADASKAGKALDDTGNKFAKFSKVAKVAGAAAGLAIVGMFKVGFGEQKDFLAGQAQLANGLKTTGNAAGVSVGQLEDLASSIQNYSGQTDDSIVASEKLLLTFTGIRNVAGKNNDIFTQTTKLTADMAAKMGGDASQYAVQLGKALNDPATGLSKLTKIGVTFTDQQKKQVAAMVKAGDTVGAQKVIIAELNKEFGGSAKAAGQTLPGQLARGQRAFEDIAQSVVGSLTPALVKIADVVIKDVMPGFSKVTGFLTGGSVAAKVLLGAIGLATAGIVAFNVATKAWAAAQKIAKVATVSWTAAQWLFNAAMSANPLALVVIGLVALGAALVLAYQKSATFRAIVQGAFAAVRAIASAVVGWFTGSFLPFFTKTIPDGFNKMKSGISRAFSAVVGFLKTWGPVALAVLVPFIGIPLLIFQHFSAIKGYMSRAWSAAYSTVRGYIGNIVGAVKGLPGRIAGVAGSLLSTGKSLMSNFWSGMRAGIGSVGGFVADIGSALARGLNNILNLPIRIPRIDTHIPGVGTVGGQTLIPAINFSRVQASMLTPQAGAMPKVNVNNNQEIRVFLGERELTDIVRAEVRTSNRATAARLASGVRI